MSKQIFGKAWISVDGKVLPTAKGAKINMGGQEREPKVGNEMLGFSETTKESTVTCTVPLRRGEDTLEILKDTINATINFETDTGHSYLVRNAFLSNTLEAEAGSDGVECVFIGNPAEPA